ncbi:FAA hydrolase family protein [Helicobacter sp. MIT 11-5569]|uniref:fumarylacetoacetate hydrolase family protein n=1 Tax=Helicobacter sp. MIT 11-5569 TaxID=1548151 RepID=UPI00051FBC31|nr:fumarylacetoacetate hydrolase family protein [Helicobacter sp. MIT 11-5569]TLD80046.1 FAA hydrolase family protein [Helicobacter sp. MIT 11-5569]
MRLITFLHASSKAPQLGIVKEDFVYPFSSAFKSAIPCIYEDMNTFICNHTQEMLESLKNVHLNAKPLCALESVELLAPILYPKQDVICLGINYLEHAKESARFKNESFDEKRENAVYFSKRVNAAVATNAKIPSHSKLTNKLDYEVELGVIIGKDAYEISKDKALEYVFGYTIINDISARDLQQKHKQWYMGKSLEGSLPMGPCIVSADTLNPQNLTIKSYVNGELRQNSHTSLMICDVASAICELSSYCTLQAGTILAMGTPSGVGMGFEPPKFLKSGDEVRCEIEGIGVLRNCIT